MIEARTHEPPWHGIRALQRYALTPVQEFLATLPHANTIIPVVDYSVDYFMDYFVDCLRTIVD